MVGGPVDWPVPNYPNLESTSAAIIQLPHDPASLRIQSDETRKRTRLWSSFLSFSTKKTAHPTTRDHLDRVTATFHPGCMGLPQELIEYIMDILQDDVVALKACSLACKSMYASTRHLIHQTLYLTEKSTQRVKAVESIPLLRRRDKVREPAKYWDLLASTGVLKYTRHVYIDIRNTIALTPHLEHLNTFDRVHMITIHSTDIRFFIPLPLPPSSPLYTTLSTLSIHFPRNPHVCLPAFIAQFPSLENLTLELIHGREEPYHPHAYPSHSPPLRGHLRCSGISQQDYLFSRTLSCDLPDGINFRSVEFSGVHRKRCQQLLRACKDNLEEFIVTIRGNGIMELGGISLGQNPALRRFVVRATFADLAIISLPVLQKVLKTIRSPEFSDFVLELGTPKTMLRSGTQSQIYGRWMEIDRRLARCGGVRLVVRTAGAHEDEAFRERTKEGFPLMAERGLISFETSLSVNEEWD